MMILERFVVVVSVGRVGERVPCRATATGVAVEELRDGALTSWRVWRRSVRQARARAFAFFYVVIAYPIACGSYDPNTQFVEACVSACVGAGDGGDDAGAYNGWSYVRDRLLARRWSTRRRGVRWAGVREGSGDVGAG